MFEEKIFKEKIFLDEVVGFVCQEAVNGLFVIQSRLTFIGFNRNQELQIFKIALPNAQAKRQIKKNEILCLRDSQISIELDKEICLEFVENVTKLWLGETEILQNVGLEYCQKICQQLQEYRRMFMFYQITDPQRREIQQLMQNIARRQINRREQARSNCMKINP